LIVYPLIFVGKVFVMVFICYVHGLYLINVAFIVLMMYTFAVPPVVLYVAEEVTGLEGNSATLQFSVARASPPVQPSGIRWFFQPTGTNNSVDITQRNSLPDGSSSLAYSSDRLSLTVGQITQQADGLFTLSATNPAGTASNSTYLIVEGKS